MHSLEAWERNLDALCDERPPDLVCFAGDIANRGLGDEYVEATELLTALINGSTTQAGPSCYRTRPCIPTSVTGAAKEALAAVLRAQRHARRFPRYARIDIRAYFAGIDHIGFRCARAHDQVG